MEDSTPSYLNAYFQGLKMLQEGVNRDRLTKAQTQEFQLQNQRLQMEDAHHKADMNQRANQFAQEQAYRDKQEQFQQAQAKTQSQERFADRGGISLDKPTDQPLPFQTGGQPQAAPPMDLSFMGAPKPATQPVGPSAQSMTPEAQGLNIVQGLPLAHAPAIPMQGTLGAEAQLPDPKEFTQESGPMGADQGKLYFTPTPYGKALQAKQAANAVNQMEVTPEMEGLFKDTDLGDHIKAGMTIDRTILPMLESAASRKMQREDREQQFTATMANNNEQKQRDREKSIAIAQIARAMKESGGISDDTMDAVHKSIMQNPDSYKDSVEKLGKGAIANEIVRLQKEPAINTVTGEHVTGLPVPSALSNTQKDQEGYKRTAIQALDYIQGIMDDPAKMATIKKNQGVIMGRMGEGEELIGDTSRLSPAEKELAQNFRSSLRYLTFQEGKSLFGSRIPIQLMEELKRSSPRAEQGIDFLKGSMAGVRRNAESGLIASMSQRYGGRIPASFYKDNNMKGREGTTFQEVPNVPKAFMDKLADGAPKIFTDKTGDHTLVKHPDGKVYEVVDK